MIMWLFFLTLCVSLALTGVFRRYALAHGLLDEPNARSSHSIPTPRGGGLAIVFSFLVGLPLLVWADMLKWQEMIALGGSGVSVALVGFLDDRGHISVRWRLVVHFSAALWGLAWIGGMPPLQVFGVAMNTGWAGQILATVYLVWMLNLYNFMDGIDGLAGLEAVTVCVGGVWLFMLGTPATIWTVPLLLSGAVAGFLFWNFPLAKIFMGDAGSGFLGVTLGLLSILAARVNPTFIWAWMILLGVFIVDATLTLLRRLVHKKKPYEAHRTHAYQHASRRYGGHYLVTLVVGAINLFWLLPLAVLSGMGHMDPVVALLVAYLPLVLLALRFNAGGGAERR